jgi:hypothetical protein
VVDFYSPTLVYSLLRDLGAFSLDLDLDPNGRRENNRSRATPMYFFLVHSANLTFCCVRKVTVMDRDKWMYQDGSDFPRKCEEEVHAHCTEASSESGSGSHDLSVQSLQESACPGR